MKNWLYIPFLVLMAFTYTRAVENLKSEEAFTSMTRAPASVPEKIQEEEDCISPAKYNPHSINKKCEL